MTKNIWLGLSLVLACCTSARAAAPESEIVLSDLDNPSGIAVQPGTGTVFVSNSGKLQVIRLVNGKAEEVIGGFSKDVYGKGPMYDIGPLGLLFLEKDTLVVGGGGKPDGEESLMVFRVPAVGAPALKPDDAATSFRLEATEDIKGEGNFYALAANKSAVFVTSNGDDTKGWVAKGELRDGQVVSFERAIATKEMVQVDAPVGITMSPRGELVVGQMGEINVPQDSLLTFYNASSGAMLMNLPTQLYDICAVAYSPKGQLYVLDFAWMKPEAAGLYQVIATTKSGKQSVETKKIAALEKPTAMAFAPDGALYVTVIGSPAEEEKDAKNVGKLLKFAPGL